VVVLFAGSSEISERDYRYRSHMATAAPWTDTPVDPTNVTSWIIRMGIGRRLWLVVPESQWGAIEARLKGAWDVFPVETGYLRRFYGAPIVYTHPSALRIPHHERVIAVIDESVRDRYQPELLDHWSQPEVADVVVNEWGH
jgi:hypothetical protein